MRWWGWGEDEHASPLSERAQEMVGSLLGVEPGAPPAERGGPESVALPAPALDAPARAALEKAVGAEHVLDDHAARLSRAAGRSYPDLVRLRSGRLEHAPDAVVRPARRGPGGRRAGRLRARPAWRWSRSAAAPAWWGAWTRCAAPTTPRSRST